jgi:hypothetical protein
MKKPLIDIGNAIIELDSSPRRRFFKWAAAAAGAILSPRWASAAVAAIHPQAGATIARLQSNGVLVDAIEMAAEPGLFLMRVRAGSTSVPLALDAVYPDGAHHRFWQAWQQGNMLQQSSPIGIRWLAQLGAGLPLNLSVAGQSLPLIMPSYAGIYVLAVGLVGGAPNLSTVTLTSTDTASEAPQLVDASSGAPVRFPHLILYVGKVDV